MGYNGAADAFGQSVVDALSNVAGAAQSSARLADAQKLDRLIDDLELTNAANLAEKHALRQALAKLQPDHPLISNKSLQERIQNAGRTAMSIAQNWEAAANAGRTFKY